MSLKSAQFFENGTNAQFEFVLSKYQEALQAKAESKKSNPDVLIKLDKWYQNELPKKIKSRGKEAHLTHEEIVKTIKWKLSRGKFRPSLKDLIQMNTPRVVMQETKKAFRAISKRNDLEAAVSVLSTMKGVGPAMASAVLAAGAPEIAPFMADELLLSMPDVDGIDYTMKEYMRLVGKTKECVERLNAQGGNWNPHKVELAVWAYYIARDLKPELLDDMPDGRSGNLESEISDEKKNDEANRELNKENVEQENQTNGDAINDDSPKKLNEPENVSGLNSSIQGDAVINVVGEEDSNKDDAVVQSKRPLEESEESAPEVKRVREEAVPIR